MPQTQPSPAIVAQNAVRRLPRIALWLLCLAYVVPGFVGRTPWKSADMTAFGYMAELARGESNWLAPTLLGLAPQVDALLPYWLGAWAIQATSVIAPLDYAVRIPYLMLLTLALVATWYGAYYLACSPNAQPVAFAFGGEASAPDYARAMADGALLALVACLGLAQLSHETTPASAQLGFSALAFYAFAALPYRPIASAIIGAVGLAGLALSGAPTVSMLFGVGGALIQWLDIDPVASPSHRRAPEIRDSSYQIRSAMGLLALTAAIALFSTFLGLWRWRIQLPTASWAQWEGIGRLLLWFTWPAWPLALWTLWRWRTQFRGMLVGRISRHLALPIWFVAVPLGNSVVTSSGDRALLLALPAMAALAAFALPTLSRSLSALIDWFTLLFFTGCAVTIWVVWIALQTGIPPQPAANVARLAPGFAHSFSYLPFFLAVCATLAWGWLVRWRVGRHRPAIWKSLVLPAGGAVLCWVLLMTLWLPLLDFARSYTVLTRSISAVVKPSDCVQTHGLDRGQIAAFRFQASLSLREPASTAVCHWLLVDRDAVATLATAIDLRHWTPQYIGYRPTDRDDDVLLYRRVSQ